MKPVSQQSHPPALGLTLSVMLAMIVLTDPAGGMALLPGPASSSMSQAETRESFAALLVQQLHRWQGGQVAIVPPSGRELISSAPVALRAPLHEVDDLRLPDSPLAAHLLNLPPPIA